MKGRDFGMLDTRAVPLGVRFQQEVAHGIGPDQSQVMKSEASIMLSARTFVSTRVVGVGPDASSKVFRPGAGGSPGRRGTPTQSSSGLNGGVLITARYPIARYRQSFFWEMVK